MHDVLNLAAGVYIGGLSVVFTALLIEKVQDYQMRQKQKQGVK